MAIVSFENNFIFVKTKKVAGTSVEGLLRTFCGSRDIITPFTPRDEVEQIDRGLPPQNYAKVRENELKFNDLIADGHLEDAIDFLGKMPKKLNNHARAKKLKAFVGSEFWQNSFTFSIERHPYSFIASKLNFNTRNYNSCTDTISKQPNLSQKLQAKIDAGILPNMGNSSWYRDEDGAILVDRVLLYENLEEELTEVLQRLGLEASAVESMPEFKSLRRFTVDDAKAIFTENQLECIYNAFRETFDTFGYES
ncbi:hypothetical protein N9C89_12675 [Halocynthiibacter sp. SDUM655004]|uniref:Sulfotransferase family protein n=2 Tax=Paracoccaceae TaxID=31989 RepID=A0AAE3J130_9RHOB|nr:hypothetical protein [Halocynthiibacter halioticoli]MCW4058410.1 hypothetical protein [Halocynthiibacter sp. SDUM655004]